MCGAKNELWSIETTKQSIFNIKHVGNTIKLIVFLNFLFFKLMATKNLFLNDDFLKLFLKPGAPNLFFNINVFQKLSTPYCFLNGLLDFLNFFVF